MFLFIIWWFVDDYLAAHFNNPAIGELDWWVVLLLSAGINGGINYIKPNDNISIFK